jgi:His/Glu/Gln/Arg/opine family amino acid ABC transporter permease subunit
MTLATLRYMGMGAGVTVMLSLAVILLSAALGMGLALLRLYGRAPVRALAAGYALVARGIPLLVLLIGSYFCLPYLGINLPIYTAAVLVMGCYFAAYMGEVFRGAIMAVPALQWDAGRSVGFRRSQIFRAVILPQARRLCVAPFLNTALSVVKNTSLVSAIGGWELVAAGREIGERTGDLMPTYLGVAFGYYLICFPLARLASFVERKSHA